MTGVGTQAPLQSMGLNTLKRTSAYDIVIKTLEGHFDRLAGRFYSQDGSSGAIKNNPNEYMGRPEEVIYMNRNDGTKAQRLMSLCLIVKLQF